MSRYQIGQYAYGYDNPLGEYFLQKGENELVGNLSNVAGTAGNLLEALEKECVEIPEDHKMKILCDWPI